MSSTSAQATPFLKFEGSAEEAINFYVKTLPNSSIQLLQKWEAGEAGTEGEIKIAQLTIAGLQVMINDSVVKHGWKFSPSLSLYISFQDEASIEQVANALADGGSFFLPLKDHGLPMSKKFAYLTDKFGVSWQLNLSQ